MGARALPFFVQPNPRHTTRLSLVQKRLEQLGAPLHIMHETAAGNLPGFLQLARARDVKDKYQDVGASAVSTQGAFVVRPAVVAANSSQSDAIGSLAVRSWRAWLPSWLPRIGGRKDDQEEDETAGSPADSGMRGGGNEPRLARKSLALVRTVDLAALVHGVRRRLGPTGSLLMKMDVEVSPSG